MPTTPGLRKLNCEVCGYSREVEAGITTMYHCAEKMVDVTDVPEEEGEEAAEL